MELDLRKPGGNKNDRVNQTPASLFFKLQLYCSITVVPLLPPLLSPALPTPTSHIQSRPYLPSEKKGKNGALCDGNGKAGDSVWTMNSTL